MKIGVHLPTYWPDYGTVPLSEAIVQTAVTASALNYDSVWANDTIIVTPEDDWAGYVIEPLTTLASLIHIVPNLQLGVCVLVLPQRNAILVAKQAAALSRLSNGRFILGIGSGWRETEFRFLNADYQNRGAHTDEAIAVMQALWQADHAAFDGSVYQFSQAMFYPKPHQNHVPLWIGGNSKTAVQRTAQYGNAWLPVNVTPQALAEGKKLLQQLKPAQPPAVAVELTIRILQTGQPVPDETTATLVGPPGKIASELQPYAAIGLSHLICDFESSSMDELLPQLHLFADQVMPALRR